jgi:hypothetical protein
MRGAFSAASYGKDFAKIDSIGIRAAQGYWSRWRSARAPAKPRRNSPGFV